MKSNRFLIISALCLAVMKCEYDVTQPKWYQDYTEPASPAITNIEPDSAVAGCNYINIIGENFSGTPTVYFDNVTAEVISNLGNSIQVRRPNLASDGCLVKVACDSALVVAQSTEPYKITQVVQKYGNFVENKELNAVAVDSVENVYVIDNTNIIYKVTPAGDKTTMPDKAKRTTYDAIIGPDGKLYLLGNNRSIDVLDPQSGKVAEWIKLKAGKVVKFGDFDKNGYLYTGGRSTGLVVVAPDLTPNYTSLYEKDEIKGIRVFGNYVYVSLVCTTPDLQNPALAIWRNPIDNSGNPGEKELVLDLTAYKNYSADALNSFSLSSDGKLFLGTNAQTPLLAIDLNTTSADYFYLGIIAPYCKSFSWGWGNYLYMICGDTALGAEWTVYRIDMGVTSARE